MRSTRADLISDIRGVAEVAIYTGSGGAHWPLFANGSFEFVAIPDGSGVEQCTYGNTVGRKGRRLLEYLPERLRAKMRDRSIHPDPEFDTFTYGDPTAPRPVCGG